jgi:hypothetical protein
VNESVKSNLGGPPVLALTARKLPVAPHGCFVNCLLRHLWGFILATWLLPLGAQPVIVAQPQSLGISLGSNGTFSVMVANPPAVQYQWRRNGSNIAGATASMLAFTNVAFGNEGIYSVLVSNAMGSVASSNCFLKISPVNQAIISWGDNVAVYGPGTDPALDSPAGIQRMMQRLRGRGYTGVYMRTDIPQFDPAAILLYEADNPLVNLLIQDGVVETSSQFDVFGTMRGFAETNGLEFWAYHPSVYSDGVKPGIDGDWPYGLQYVIDNPEVITVDRDGTNQYMVREYAYPGARAAKVQELVYLGQTYGIRNFFPSMRTEAAQLTVQSTLPTKADQFGFNQPIVDAMETNYGVNILTDPRFDINSASYSPTNPMVTNWQNLRGGYLTQFYRDLRAAVNALDPDARVVTAIPGDHIGPELGNWLLDWRTWVNEGLVNELIVDITLEGNPQSLAGKDYLTDARDGIGTLPLSTYRSFFDDSPHPETKLLQGGQYEAFPTPLPAGSDGWQTFWTVEAFDVAWFQRWQQWKTDIRDFGYIKFFEQNFDTFPTNSIANGGAFGDGRGYHPDLRACPGAWYYLGRETDTRATVQSAIKHGAVGNALKITSLVGETEPIFVRHSSGFDGTSFQARTDNLINNGTCSFEFWLYHPDSQGSLQAFLQYDGSPNNEIGFYMESGAVYYMLSGGTWASTGYNLPAGQWQKFTIEVNLAALTYSLYAGATNELVLCQNNPYTVPFNGFNQLYFQPVAPQGNVTYLDDVALKWFPATLYGSQSRNVYLADNFEADAVDSALNGVLPQSGAAWTASSPTNAQIENKLSFGDGFKCLRVIKPAGANSVSSGAGAPLALQISNQVTLDFDVYFRTTSYQTVAGLRKSSGGAPTAAISAAGGTWQVWSNGAYTNTGVNLLAGNGGLGLWNHVQIALNASNRTYRVVIQPVGSMPVLLGTFPWDAGTKVGDSVFFQIDAQGSTGQIVYYDNILMTYGLLDTDGDGIPDEWEIAHGLNPNDPSDAAQDPDGDGMTNWQEYIAGTDPHDPNSNFHITSTSINNGTITVGFMTITDRNYSLDWADSPCGPWTTLKTIAGTGAAAQLNDTIAGAPIRFYRLSVW